MERLGEVLLSIGALGAGTLNRALALQRSTGGRLGTILLEQGLVTEETLARALTKVTGRPYAHWDRIREASRDAIVLLPSKLAIRAFAVPFERDGRVLRVAMRDPNDLAAEDEMALVTGKKIEPWCTAEFRLAEALERFYGERRSARFRVLAERIERGLRPQAPAPPPPPPPSIRGDPNRPESGSIPAAPRSRPADVWQMETASDEIEIATWRPRSSPFAKPAETGHAIELEFTPDEDGPVETAPAPPPEAAPPRSEPPGATRAEAEPAAERTPTPPPPPPELRPVPVPPAAEKAPIAPRPPEPPRAPTPPIAPAAEGTPAAENAPPPPSPETRTAPPPPPAAMAPEVPPAPELPRTPTPPAETTADVAPPAKAPPAAPAPEPPPAAPVAGRKRLPKRGPAEPVTPAALSAGPPDEPAPAPWPRPETLEQTRELIRAAEARDDIADAALAYIEPDFPLVSLLIARKEDVIGWQVRAKGASRSAFKKVRIPFQDPSIFLNVKLSGTPYQGLLPGLPSHAPLIDALGRAPERVAVFPVLLKKRVVAFLFLELESKALAPDRLDEMKALASAIADGLAALILQQRGRADTA